MIKVAALLLFVASNVVGQEATFSISDLDGRTAEYEHRFSAHLTSDRGQQLAYPGGNEVDIEILGVWKSAETRTVNDSGKVVVTATVKDGDSWAKQNGNKLTFEQYPFNIEQLNNKSYSWELSPLGAADMKPDFRPWGIKQRTDVINDLAIIWFSGMSPVLPEGPVKEGDTWTGEQKIERPFYKLGARNKTFMLTLNSTYEVEKVSKKKGTTIVEVSEKREISFSGWVETVAFSVLLEEGSGKGAAEWEIDTDGLVRKCSFKMNVDRPLLRTYGAEHPVPDAESNYLLVYEAEMKKLK